MSEKSANETLYDTLFKWREELTGFLKEIYLFNDADDPLNAMKRLSAMSARASFMRSVTVRQTNRQLTIFRQDELDPFLKEVELQFRIWSRIAAITNAEWGMSRY
jgi:hypothetical protein